MKYCENCGAKLSEGMKFCEECGAPVEDSAAGDTGQDSIEVAAPEIKQEKSIAPDRERVQETPEPAATAMELVPARGIVPSTENLRVPNELESKKSRGKAVAITLIALLLLAGAAIAIWETALPHKEAKTAAVTPSETADPNNLYGTLNWQEDQDKTYAFKTCLIEGNSDANIKEIFEESAYFTPSEYKYAEDGNVKYYLITCEYKKDEETAPYALVFQTNKNEHLELAELYKSEQRVDKSDVEEFYKSLYITKDDLSESKEKAKEKAAAETKSDQEYYFKENENHWFYNAEKDAYLELMYFGGDCVFANMWGGEYDETMDEFDFNFSDLYFFANTSGKENHIIANEPYFCDEGEGFQLNLTVTTTDDVTDEEFPYMVIIEDELYPDTSLVSGTYYEYYPDM